MHLSAALLLPLCLSPAGGLVFSTAPFSTVHRWASCAREVIQRNSAAAKGQLNAYAQDPAGAFGRDLLDLLLPPLEEGTSFSVNLAPYPSTVDFNQRNLVLIVVDSLGDFGEKHLQRLVDKNVEFRGYFLLLLVPSSRQHVTGGEVRHMLARMWDFRVHNMLLAIARGGQGVDGDKNDEAASGLIELVSYTPYGPGCCGCVRPHVIDRCVDGRLVNGSVALYGRFERNLYGCPLRIAAFQRAPFMQFDDGTPPRLSGIEGALVQLLAEKLNFTVAIVQPPDGRVWGRIYPNGSANGAMRLLLDGRVHLTLGRYFPYPRLLTNTTQSYSYYISDLVLAVPEALDPASPLEQLLKPFRGKIWLLLALELTLGFGALLLLACVGHSPGGRVALDFWCSFLGESLPALPRPSTVRFALMLWILHSALLRECYKGGLVGFLTEPIPLNDIRSIGALLEGGYRFAMTETVYHKVFVEGAHRIEHRLTLVEPARELDLLERTIATGARLAIANTREEIVTFNKRNRTVINYRTSDEKLLTFHFCMYFKRSSPVVTAFDWWIRRVLATGHMTRWRDSNLDRRFMRPTLAQSGQAEVLHLHHLLGSFLLLVGGLTVAGLAFTLELPGWLPRGRATVVPAGVGRTRKYRVFRSVCHHGRRKLRRY